MTGNIEYKTLAGPVEIKAAEGQQDEGKLHIKAYVLAFGNIDSWGDIIQPSACDEFLKSENAERMHLCYQHKLDEVIGVISEIGNAIAVLVPISCFDPSILFNPEYVSGYTLGTVLNLNFLLPCAILYLMSHVFRYGEELQQLSDETL